MDARFESNGNSECVESGKINYELQRTYFGGQHAPKLGKSSRHVHGLKTFADLFCGVGGFHVAASQLGLECTFASDIDEAARDVYWNNFRLEPQGDITKIQASEIPNHDILFAGFPCQPFSIIGNREGFDDARNGQLFFEVARIIEDKRPKAIVLENVRQLATAAGGQVIGSIQQTLEELGYCVDYRVLNALHFGLPQKRERVIIVGTREPFDVFPWPTEVQPMKPLSEVLEKTPDKRHLASDRIRRSRHQKHQATETPSIWHENKAGNISSHPFSCALRAGASYNYLLVDGERRLTPREMFRLQGFPDEFQLHASDAQARRQAGNSVPVPLVKAAIKGVLNVYAQSQATRQQVAA